MNYKQLEEKMLKTLAEREQQKYFNNYKQAVEPSASIMFKWLSLETTEDEVNFFCVF